MYHFFINSNQINADKAFVTGEDYNHIKNVLRLKPGEKAVLSDADGGTYACRLDGFEEDERAIFTIEGPSADTELPLRITIYQGLPKVDKLETIIQKCVELGAYRIVPVEMKRCVVKLDAKKKESKQKRWQAISQAAAKQSGRCIIPEVAMPMPYAMAVQEAVDSLKIVPYEEAKDMRSYAEILPHISKAVKVIEAAKAAGYNKAPLDIAVFIGPEGGFDYEEIEKAKQSGAHIVSLGKRILRTETAGPAILSALMLHIEMAREEKY